nr:ATP-dependent DNA ligase [Microbacterium testaceum]
MGRLIYRDRASFDIDDRILAHLRIVVMNKLRRNEGFMLQLPVNEGVRQASLWIHASNALVMQFYGGREPAIDRALVDQMMHDASGADGLTLTAAGIAPQPTPTRQPVGGRART